MYLYYIIVKMGSREKLNLLMFLMLVVVALIAIHQLMLAINSKPAKNVAPTSMSEMKVYKEPVYLPNVVVHLDLKGFPPKLSYLMSLAPKLRALGVTGFLIEYEDMFPYEGDLAILSRKHAYKKTELQDFLKYISNLGFDTIPLIQTFGHMEFVLKNKEFAHLREVPSHTNVICPSRTKSRVLIRKMLKQVIRFHQNIPLKYIHIGCDEVYYINECNQCRQRREKNLTIFLKHVKSTVAFVKKLSPDTKVLIWEDMMRHAYLDDFLVNIIVEPVYWDYSNTVIIKKEILDDYSKKFGSIWIASAFKGADGKTGVLPILGNRFSNHLSWLKLVQNYQVNEETYNFKGIILTGWSRYFHDAPPCELFPVAIPSLFLNLLLIAKFQMGNNWTDTYSVSDFFDKNMKDDVLQLLKCDKIRSIYYFNANNCDFDGKDLYEMFFQCEETLAISVYSAIFENDKTNFNESCSNKEDLVNKLSRYYDKPFVEEYVNYRYNPEKKRNIFVPVTNYYIEEDPIYE